MPSYRKSWNSCSVAIPKKRKKKRNWMSRSIYKKKNRGSDMIKIKEKEEVAVAVVEVEVPVSI